MKVLNRKMKCSTSTMVRTISDTYFTVHSSSDMLFSGVLLCSSKHATQHGDGLALISYWKNSLGTYHETSKVRNKKKLFPPPWKSDIYYYPHIFGHSAILFLYTSPAIYMSYFARIFEGEVPALCSHEDSIRKWGAWWESAGWQYFQQLSEWSR